MHFCLCVETAGINLFLSSSSIIVTIAGKWVTPREQCVRAKGKGDLETFWLSISEGKGCGRENIPIHEVDFTERNKEL